MKFELGQTYICTESYDNYWTDGKEYEVQLRTGKTIYTKRDLIS